jgi:hypothetical protein
MRLFADSNPSKRHDSLGKPGISGNNPNAIGTRVDGLMRSAGETRRNNVTRPIGIAVDAVASPGDGPIDGAPCREREAEIIRRLTGNDLADS